MEEMPHVRIDNREIIYAQFCGPQDPDVGQLGNALRRYLMGSENH
jgi:hypothetical protein